MIKYKLLKDLPTFKAGDMFYISQYGALIYDDGGFGVMVYSQSTLKKFPNILTDWFEEIQEPTDSIHWKPKKGDEYFYISDYGNVYSDIWSGKSIDNERLVLGAIYRTEEECEVRLRRMSNLKPDWNNDNQNKWTVYYDHNSKELFIEATAFLQYPSAIYFDTYDSVKKSIKENREDWLIYFGIEEEK